MSLKTVFAVLILGSSSVALAKPVSVRDHRDPTIVLTDSRINDPRIAQFAPPPSDADHLRMRRPISLATGVQITSNFRDHRAERPLFIDVNQRLGGLAQLRFDQRAGRTYIDSIVVMMPNGRSRTFTVKQMLSNTSPSITIDLDSRAITGIYVYGSSLRARGSFDVTGMIGTRRYYEPRDHR